MNFTTGRFRDSLLRVGTAVALSVFAVGMSVAPASAQDNGNHNGWYKNGKAEQKAAKRAARLNSQNAQRSTVIVDNGTVVDRSRVHVDTRTPRRGTNNNANGYVYRNGAYYDRNGNRVYDYRGSNVDPYRAYPQYRQNNGYYGGNSGYYGGNGGYYGGNSGYYGGNGGYSNGYPNYGSYNNGKGNEDRDDVARRAAQSGYNAGFQRGQYDAYNRNRPVPTGHGAYQFGYDGYDPSWGWASTYQQSYRQYFVQGYNDGYSGRRSTRRW